MVRVRNPVSLTSSSQAATYHKFLTKLISMAILEITHYGVDLFSLPKVTVGKLALAWGWLRKPMIPLVFLLTFQFPFEGAKA